MKMLPKRNTTDWASAGKMVQGHAAIAKGSRKSSLEILLEPMGAKVRYLALKPDQATSSDVPQLSAEPSSGGSDSTLGNRMLDEAKLRGPPRQRHSHNRCAKCGRSRIETSAELVICLSPSRSCNYLKLRPGALYRLLLLRPALYFSVGSLYTAEIASGAQPLPLSDHPFFGNLIYGSGAQIELRRGWPRNDNRVSWKTGLR